MSIAEKLTAIAENEQKVYDAGKQAEYDRFWDVYQYRGQSMNYSHKFYAWEDSIYNPKYPIYSKNYMNGAFSYANFTDVKVPIISEGATMSSLFDSWTKGITIPELRVTENSTYANAFRYCTNLETVNFTGVIGKNGLNLQWSTKLSHDSLMSLINCLQDKTGDTSGTSWEVTIGAENLAKLTQDERKIAENKGWVIG